MNGNFPGLDCAEEYKYKTNVPPTINGRLLYIVYGARKSGCWSVGGRRRRGGEKGGERSRRGTVV